MIKKIVSNLHKDLKTISEVEQVEGEEVVKEVEEIALNVERKVICLENVLIKIANKKEWAEEEDKINVLIVTKKAICQKIVQNKRKKEEEVVNAITVKKMAICQETVLNQRLKEV